MVTPYIGAGVVYSRGKLDSPLGFSLEESNTRRVVYAGVTLSLLVPKIHIEVEKGGGPAGGGAGGDRFLRRRLSRSICAPTP